MTRRNADALLGLLVIAVVGVLVFALSRTEGWTQRRFDLYMITESAQDLSADTRVFLQGLEVGRLQSLSPLVDPSMGRPRFLATLRLRQYYENRARLILPVGTTAEVRSLTGLTGTYIALQVPVRPYAAAALGAGDTITALRRPSALEALSQVVDSLKDQVTGVLNQTQSLLQRLNQTADLANRQLEATAPEIRGTLTEARETLARLRPTLDRATDFLTHADQRLGSLQDSVTVTLTSTRVLVGHLDSLSLSAHSLVAQNQQDIRQTVNNLLVLSAKMDYFMDEISRHPLKMISGVRPLPPESLPPEPKP